MMREMVNVRTALGPSDMLGVASTRSSAEAGIQL